MEVKTCPHCGKPLSDKWVPVEILQQAVSDSSRNYNQIALALGFVKQQSRPPRADGLPRATVGDTSRLKRMLGLAPVREHRRVRYQTHAKYETAVKIIRACDLDPVDYDF